MMKKIITSPYRKLKVLLIVPVFAIIFYAFAEPEKKYSEQGIDSAEAVDQSAAGNVKGIVLKETGQPFEGVQIAVTGTVIRGTTDASGNFYTYRSSGRFAPGFFIQGLPDTSPEIQILGINEH